MQYLEFTATTGTDTVIDLSTNAPVLDPDSLSYFTNCEKYIYRIVLIRAGLATFLDLSADATYDTTTKHITIANVLAGDTFKVWYTNANVPSVMFTPNTTDASALAANSVSIYLYIPGSGSPSSSNYLYRLQSASIDVSFTREDLMEIGNTQIVQRGINTYKVSVKLGRILEQFTMEEVLRGEAPGYGKLDIQQLTDNASLIVKVFSDDTKQTFLYGFKADNLCPSDLSNGAGINAYVKADNTIEGETLIISSDNTQLGNFS